MIREGFSILFAGMGTVFVFLILLIYSVTGLSSLVRYFSKKMKPTKMDPLQESQIIAALTAIAIKQKKLHITDKGVPL